LVGAYPFDEAELPKFKERIQAYVRKAAREAKENTNWTQINEAYEEGYASFIDTLLSSEHGNDFLDSLRSFQSKVKQYGIYNSLSQLLLKIASPGIPDFYQGSELWDLSLVDPDNRRPVDYGKRAHLLDAMKSQWEIDPVGLAKDVVANWEDGRIKLFLILRGLAVRKSLSDVFEAGHYVPLEVTGTHAGRVIAFARKGDDGCAIALMPRFASGLVSAGDLPCGTEVWGDTAVVLPSNLENAEWKNWLTDSTVLGKDQLLVGEVLKAFPVALLSNG
ncbi:MAG: malto-oligosyltrehalose synthase, partial [Cyanobacteria bacterium P01_C01_bin.121]